MRCHAVLSCPYSPRCAHGGIYTAAQRMLVAPSCVASGILESTTYRLEGGFSPGRASSKIPDVMKKQRLNIQRVLLSKPRFWRDVRPSLDDFDSYTRTVRVLSVLTRYANATQRAATVEAVTQLETHDVVSLGNVLNVSFGKVSAHA